MRDVSSLFKKIICNFICYGGTRKPSCIHSFLFLCLDKPTNIVFKIANHENKYNVMVGENVPIICKAKGFPTPDYIIFHNGTSLTNVVKGMTTIKSVNYSDDGQYKCIAKNILGNVSASFNLIVQGKICFITDHCVMVCSFYQKAI